MPKSIINSFNLKANFWSNNPQLITIFNDIYEKDTSKDKDRTSKVMWAIALLVDPNDNNSYRNMLYEDKLKILSENYIKEKNFNWVVYDDVIERYKKYVLTKTEYTILVMERKLEERLQLLNDTTLTLQNAELLDKLQINISKLKAEIKNLHKLLKDDDSNVKIKGDKKVGLLDSGLL